MKSPQDMRIIQIDITNACMYRCSNCTRFCGHHKKNFFMDFETFKRAVDSMIGYHGTIGIMGGEPTLHPEFERFVKYLQTNLPSEYIKNDSSLVRPQKDFIESILLENKVNSEIYNYTTGPRETVMGVGLWSAMVPSYKKNYELIQDVFKMQAVNDHGNIMYHSPIFINRKDMGIPDDKWYKIRDNCWAQDIWSATITPKGAFFCEIAGALDMLFDGPGGWPIESGWWKRTPDQFGDQLKWCELCGIALETFTRNANDWIDDVSKSMYEKLKEIDSPKLKKDGRINIVEIENGQISEKSKQGTKEVRKDLFFDSFNSRFNANKSVLYPGSINAIIEIDENNSFEDILSWIAQQGDLFDKVSFIVRSEKLYCKLTVSFKDRKNLYLLKVDEKWGHSFIRAHSNFESLQPVFYLSKLMYLKENFIKELRECVINPGTLHYVNCEISDCDLLKNQTEGGVIALYHLEASSLKKAGFDYITNSISFNDIVSIWNTNKVICLSEDMIEDFSCNRIKSHQKYAVYGAGNTGKSAIRQISELNSEVVIVCDSDKNKWNKTIGNYVITSPYTLLEKRTEYNKIIIASTFYQGIQKKLLELGFVEDDYIIFE